jgi:hypothetical protein
MNREKLRPENCIAFGKGKVFGTLCTYATVTAALSIFIFAALTRFILILNNESIADADRFWGTMFHGLLLFWPLMLIEVAVIKRKALLKYWCRNVIGHTLWYWSSGEKNETKITVNWRQSSQLNSINPFFLQARIPLGGWFCGKPSLYHPKDTKLKVIGFKDGKVMALVKCKDGSRIIVDVESGIWLAGCSPAPGEMLALLRQQLRELPLVYAGKRDMETHFNNIVGAALDATVRIANTSRLGQSKEAREIRELLRQAILANLDPNDPRITYLKTTTKSRHTRRNREKN